MSAGQRNALGSATPNVGPVDDCESGAQRAMVAPRVSAIRTIRCRGQAVTSAHATNPATGHAGEKRRHQAGTWWSAFGSNEKVNGILRRGGEAVVPAVWPRSRGLPQARDLLDSMMVPHRTRVIGGCRHMRRHIPPVAPPVIVNRTQHVKRRQPPMDETCQGVQLRRLAGY